MNIDLSGKVLIVTGAASGIGAATARLAVAAGATCLLTDRDGGGVARLAGELGAGHVVADLMERDGPSAVAAGALSRHGRIDGVVNAAGLTDRASVATGTLDLWDRLFAVNARAPFVLMQAAIADMLSRKATGGIVNIGSVNAHCGPADLGIYSASKGALVTLTKNAANAHLADRIRVNAINPGWVATPAEDRMQAQTLGLGAGWQAAAGATLPLGRLLDADEIARLAIWLLSDLSAPMTGVCLDLDQKVMGAP